MDSLEGLCDMIIPQSLHRQQGGILYSEGQEKSTHQSPRTERDPAPDGGAGEKGTRLRPE